jgi:DNA repair photolyase
MFIQFHGTLVAMSRACAPDQTTPAPANLALFEPDASVNRAPPRRTPSGLATPRERRWPQTPATRWLLNEPAAGLPPGESPAALPLASGLTLTPSRTQVISENCTSLLRVNDAPELPFPLSINPYRGCEHGCLACPSPTLAASGVALASTSTSGSPSAPAPASITLYAKSNAADRLRLELRRPGYRPRPICLGSAADAYQPAERQQRLTRAIVEVLAEARHPFGLTTRSAGIVRDLDLLAPLAEPGLVLVLVSLSTLNPLLAERLEPHASPPALRLTAMRQLARAGVWVGVNLAPLMPGVNDDEVEALISAAAQAGVQAVRWQGHAAISGDPLVAPLAAPLVAPLVTPLAADADWRAALADRVRAAAEAAGLATTLPGLTTSLFQPPRAPDTLAERAHRQKNLF